MYEVSINGVDHEVEFIGWCPAEPDVGISEPHADEIVIMGPEGEVEWDELPEDVQAHIMDLQYEWATYDPQQDPDYLYESARDQEIV